VSKLLCPNYLHFRYSQNEYIENVHKNKTQTLKKIVNPILQDVSFKTILENPIDFEILHMGHDTLKNAKKFNQN